MEKKKMTVCFSDITNFTRIMEKYDEEKIVELLQTFFSEIGDIIVQNDGEIRKYVGDSLLFTFENPQNAIAAIKKIAEIRKILDEFIIETHVSAATGEVLVTEIGHESYKITDILGSTINQAAILLRKASASETNYALCPETSRYL